MCALLSTLGCSVHVVEIIRGVHALLRHVVCVCFKTYLLCHCLCLRIWLWCQCPPRPLLRRRGRFLPARCAVPGPSPVHLRSALHRLLCCSTGRTTKRAVSAACLFCTVWTKHTGHISFWINPEKTSTVPSAWNLLAKAFWISSRTLLRFQGTLATLWASSAVDTGSTFSPSFTTSYRLRCSVQSAATGSFGVSTSSASAKNGCKLCTATSQSRRSRLFSTRSRAMRRPLETPSEPKRVECICIGPRLLPSPFTAVSICMMALLLILI